MAIKSFFSSKNRGEGKVGCTMFMNFFPVSPIHKLDPIPGANQYLE
jgi:hypothetical protein